MTKAELIELAERCERAEGADNSLDVRIEVALFPEARANSAGTKVIYLVEGKEKTFLADEWTLTPESRKHSGELLRARASMMGDEV